MYADLHPLRKQLFQLSDNVLVEMAFGYSGPTPPLGELFGFFGTQSVDMPADAQRRCFASAELMARALASSLRLDRPVFDRPQVVREYLKLRLGGRSAETFAVLYLDSMHRLIEYEEVFHGTLTQTSVYPRELVKRALLKDAAALVLAHNHPSGTPEPSRSDEAITGVIKAAMALVDVKVLDHFIVTSDTACSMAELGRM
jgi:DNA repair protein RadC